jgi:hypothetical protein
VTALVAVTDSESPPAPILGVTVVDAVGDSVEERVTAPTVGDTVLVAVTVTVGVPVALPAAGPSVFVLDTEGVEVREGRPLPEEEGDADAVPVTVGVPVVEGDVEEDPQLVAVLQLVGVSWLDPEMAAERVPCAARASPGPLGLPVAEDVPEGALERLLAEEALREGEAEAVREPSGERLTVGDAEGLWPRDPDAQELEDGLIVTVTVCVAELRTEAEEAMHAVGDGEAEAFADAEREPLGVKVPVTVEDTDHDADATEEGVMRRVTQSGVYVPVTDTLRVTLGVREASGVTDAEKEAEEEAMERVAEADLEGRLLAELERHAELVKDVVEERHWVGVGDREKVGMGVVQGETVRDGVMVRVAVEDVEGLMVPVVNRDAEGEPERELWRDALLDPVSQRDTEGDPVDVTLAEGDAESANESDNIAEGEMLSEKLVEARGERVPLPPEGVSDADTV